MKPCRFLFILLFLTLPFISYAQDPPAAPLLQSAFPGVAEVIPQAAQLTEDAVKAESLLADLKDLSALDSEIALVQERQAELLQRISGYGNLSEWSFDRLIEQRGRLNTQLAGVRRILETLAQKLTEADQIRQRWLEREEFWKQWQSHLKSNQVEIPKGPFAESLATSRRISESAAQSSPPLVALQKTVTDLQTDLLAVQNQIDGVLNSLRMETFKKTTHSFFNGEFYQQFNSELLLSLYVGIAEVPNIKWEFLTDRPWLPAIQILLALALTLLIRRYRRDAQLTEEWHFIAVHPWATGIFVSVISLSSLYINPPALWRCSISILAAVTAAVLVSDLLKNPRKKFMVYLLAALFIITQGLQLIAFPSPLYRLYLTLLCLLGIPLLLVLAKRNLKAEENRTDAFTLALRLGAWVLGAALLAQISGYSNLASRLIISSVNTVFLSIFLAMFIRLGQGAIRFLLGHPVVLRQPFFYRYGDDLAVRLAWILKLFVGTIAFLSLLVVWGLYDSAGQAWTALMEKSVQLGEVTLSLQMLVLALLVLYLAINFSWLLRAILETQIFPQRDFDRGIKDAIKKLLHYFIVFIGFLLAMSLAGIEMKNFAVLAGAFGIGIGFGLQNIVNNFISGIILLFERPVRVGDVVVIDTQWSTVRKIGLRSTIVETPNKSEIIVPNSELISQKVTNWTLSSSMARVTVPVGVAYGSNVQQVLNLLREAADTNQDVLETPEPSPIFTGFGESALNFELRAWIADADRMLAVRSQILQYLELRLREEDIEIPFPQRDLHLRVKDVQALQQQLRSATDPAAEEF